nr:retrovirus-related Pol polyprotein from transposon TNT 1-94 [Tanacetum cinerariifolium]
MTDANEIWEAIKSRFGGNDESKKMFQSLLSQLETHGAGVSTKDANQKFLRSLPSSWSQVSLIMRTKPGVDTLSFDDLYNNLRVLESDVKGSSGSSSSTQNEGSSSYTAELMYSFFANQSSGPKWDHDDIEQLDEFDLEEIVLKWQDEPKAMVTIDGEDVDWTGHAEDDTKDYALMAFNSSNSGSDTEMSAKDKSRLGYGTQIHEGVLSYENEVLESVFGSRPSDIEDSPANDRFAKVEGMHASKNGKFDAKTSDLASCDSNSSVETLESVPKPVESKPKAVSEPKVWSDAPIIEEYESDSDDKCVSKSAMKQETPNCAFINTIKHV